MEWPETSHCSRTSTGQWPSPPSKLKTKKYILIFLKSLEGRRGKKRRFSFHSDT
tara:strand:+ start:682 stop:843 length:162 start_codon:yes stop_codon:yes gene_type:complete